ncbi:MAG: hypothetical protein JSV34_00895 [Candidatus Omnitrophota bacterium]|nr:MAG: hypothetical protein JSV34_00895 [Candidatus Omnitrophota bacterium]
MELKDIKDATLVWGALSAETVKLLKKTARAVVVPEIRPALVGLYHNAPLLRKADIEVVCCCDNVVGLLFYKGKISKTVLCYKRQVAAGVVARAGSLYAALLSKLHKVPVEAVLEGNVDCQGVDKDVSTLGGRRLIGEDDCTRFVIKPDDEVLGEEVLR